jgi:integrase/recombinase XerD
VSALRARAEQYLAMRRTLGFKLTTQGRHLMSFVRFCEDRCAEHVTASLAVEWATQVTRGSGNEVYQARRLDVVRIFARHLQPLDPAGCRWMTVNSLASPGEGMPVRGSGQNVRWSCI